MSNLTLYGSVVYLDYFRRGATFTTGTFNFQPFVCISKSGSQNLWLPIWKNSGLKVFHPNGCSGTYEKAKQHFDAQDLLASRNLAPLPLQLLHVAFNALSVNPTFETPISETPILSCYGALMVRVLNGSPAQIETNLSRFGVQIPLKQYARTELSLKLWGQDALTLMEYAALSRHLDAPNDKINERAKEITNELKNQIPKNFDVGPDLLTPTNIVLDEKGNAKVVDFDLCSYCKT